MAAIDYPGRFRTAHEVTTDVDISSDEFWNKSFSERDESFSRLREEAPVSWHPPRHAPEVPEQFQDAGFWAITKNEDVTAISQDHETYS